METCSQDGHCKFQHGNITKCTERDWWCREKASFEGDKSNTDVSERQFQKKVSDAILVEQVAQGINLANLGNMSSEQRLEAEEANTHYHDLDPQQKAQVTTRLKQLGSE